MFEPVFYRYIIKFLITSLMMFATISAQAEAPANYPFTSYDQAIHAAQASGRKIFVYYGRYGCGFCDKTNKESFSNDQVHKVYTDNYELAYIDAEGGKRLRLPSGERITEQQFGPRNKIIGTPYFMYLETDGSVIFKVPGFKTANDFIQFDKYISGQHYKTQSFAEFAKGPSL